jgi:hypothetical protein
MAKNKQNPLLAKYEAMYEAKYRAQLQMSMQIGLDAGMIAANDVLGMGAGRAEKFRNAYIETVNEMMNMIVVDDKDDPNFEWTKETIDKRLRAIVGETNFVPWESRYGKGF